MGRATDPWISRQIDRLNTSPLGTIVASMIHVTDTIGREATI